MENFEITLGGSSCELCGYNQDSLEYSSTSQGFTAAARTGCYGGDNITQKSSAEEVKDFFAWMHRIAAMDEEVYVGYDDENDSEIYDYEPKAESELSAISAKLTEAEQDALSKVSHS